MEKVTTRCLHFTISLVLYKQKPSMVKLLQVKCLLTAKLDQIVSKKNIVIYRLQNRLH